MRQSTVGELKSFLATIPDDYQVWTSPNDIHVAPFDAREKVQTFSGMQPDTEEMRKQMHAIAVSDYDCPTS